MKDRIILITGGGAFGSKRLNLIKQVKEKCDATVLDLMQLDGRERRNLIKKHKDSVVYDLDSIDPKQFGMETPPERHHKKKEKIRKRKSHGIGGLFLSPKIGSIFEHEGEKYRVMPMEKESDCQACCFGDDKCEKPNDRKFNCVPKDRTDKRRVYFKKLN